MREILLMTATITPDAAMTGLAVNDPEQRRWQYEQALAFYANHFGDHFDGIVLAENSGAELESFRRCVWPGTSLELISTPPTRADDLMGRGYPETILVADAMQVSELLEDGMAVKVTGRYRVRNLDRMLRSMDFDEDCGFNSRSVPRPWTDMAVYFANRAAMCAIRAHADLLTEGPQHLSPERSLGHVLDLIEEDGVTVQRRFRAEARIEGVRGWDGRAYGSVRQNAKWALRSTAKQLTPMLWI
jgi:hypothetical protein